MTIIPPYLQKGDTIGIVCPAGFMPMANAETCIRVLQEWGYKVKIGSTLGAQYHYFSGTDEQRLTDLQQMLDDDTVQAVLCGRGGYGTGRIIERVSFKNFKKKPKWIIGYSDITILHCHIIRRHKISSMHSPMAAAFNEGESNNKYVQSLRKALAGKKSQYSCQVHRFNRQGSCSGQLMGGNLSILAHLIGTASDLNTAGKILFIEEIGEYIYNIDRMLYQLKRNGKLAKLAGLVIGSFTETKDTTIPFGKEVYEVIFEIVQEYDYPVCFRFPAGHSKENYCLKVGVEHTLSVESKHVLLSEN
jgi:muramoyltetrapeptide carboxypeptidase